MKVAIVDDNREFSVLLRSLLESMSEQYHFQMEIDIFNDLTEFLNTVVVYHVYFLSVELSSVSGIDLAHILRERGLEREIVFYSDSDLEMRRAFFEKPCGFLRKQHLESDLKELFDLLKYVFRGMEKEIAIKDNLSSIIIRPDEIMYLHSSGHYVQLFNKSGTKLVVRNTLTQLQEQLHSFGFFRIHLRYLVNRMYVQDCQRDRILLQNKAFLPVSKTYWQQIRFMIDK